jgi:hypothetical protein
MRRPVTVIAAVVAVIALCGGGASASPPGPATGLAVRFGLVAFSGEASIAALRLPAGERVSDAELHLVLHAKGTHAAVALAVLRHPRSRRGVVMAMISDPIAPRDLPAGLEVTAVGKGAPPVVSAAPGVYSQLNVPLPELCAWPGLRGLRAQSLRLLATKGRRLPHIAPLTALALAVRAVCRGGQTTALAKALGRCPGETPLGEGCVRLSPQPAPGPPTPVPVESPQPTEPPHCAPCDPAPGEACPLSASAAVCVAGKDERPAL